MKKMYITPAVEINETMASQMMALSAMPGNADDKDALVNQNKDWDMWDSEQE